MRLSKASKHTSSTCGQCCSSDRQGDIAVETTELDVAKRVRGIVTEAKVDRDECFMLQARILSSSSTDMI